MMHQPANPFFACLTRSWRVTPAAAAIVFCLFGLSSNSLGATPWQMVQQAQCGASANCILTFPAVPAAKRLEVRYVGCEIRSQEGAYSVGEVRFYLQTKQNGKTISLDLSMRGSGTQGGGGAYYSARGETVTFYVPPQQMLKIVAWPTTGYTIDQMNCAVRGELTDAASTVPYQATVGKLCGATANCILTFPNVPAGKRFDVRYAACEIRSPNETTSTMRFILQTKQGGTAIAEDLATVQAGNQYDSGYTNVYSTVSQPVQFSVPAGERLSITGWNSQDGSTVDRMDCTVVGAMNDAATTPYQVTAFAKCEATTNCIVAFPATPPGRQLELEYVACELQSDYGASAAPATTINTRLYLRTQQNGKPITLSIANPWPAYQYDATTYYSAVSQPVQFSVPAQQVLNVVAWPSSVSPPQTSTIRRMNCTISGQLT